MRGVIALTSLSNKSHTNRVVAGLALTLAHLCSTPPATAQQVPRLVRVFVALADNEHQGIVPVPKALANGNDPGRNLYWGAAYRVKTFFQKRRDWK